MDIALWSFYATFWRRFVFFPFSEDKTKQLEEHSSGTNNTTNPASSTTQLSSNTNSSFYGEQKITNNPSIVEDLFAHRNAICVPYRRLSSARSTELNVFGVEEIALANMHIKEIETTSSALSDMIDPSERKVSEFPSYLPSVRRSRSRVLYRSSLRRMKLQTTANKEDEYDLGEDEDQGESEDYDVSARLKAISGIHNDHHDGTKMLNAKKIKSAWRTWCHTCPDSGLKLHRRRLKTNKKLKSIKVVFSPS